MGGMGEEKADGGRVHQGSEVRYQVSEKVCGAKRRCRGDSLRRYAPPPSWREAFNGSLSEGAAPKGLRELQAFR
jgi:hypothetical protein